MKLKKYLKMNETALAGIVLILARSGLLRVRKSTILTLAV